MKGAFFIVTAKSAALAHLFSLEVNVGAMEIGHGIDDDVKQILRGACAGMKNILCRQPYTHNSMNMHVLYTHVRSHAQLCDCGSHAKGLQVTSNATQHGCLATHNVRMHVCTFSL